METIPAAQITAGVHHKVKAAIAALESKINQVLNIQTVKCEAESDSSKSVCTKVSHPLYKKV